MELLKLKDDTWGRNEFEKILPVRPLRILLENAERLGLSVPLDPVEVMKCGCIQLLRCKEFGRESLEAVGAALKELGLSKSKKFWESEEGEFERLLPFRTSTVIRCHAEYLGLSIPLRPEEVIRVGPAQLLSCRYFGQRHLEIVGGVLKELGYSGWTMKMELTGKNVFQNYDMIRPQVLELVKKSKEEMAQGRGILTILSSDLVLYLMRYFPKITPRRLENFCNFIVDIPVEIAFFTFVCRVDDEPRNSGVFKYLANLHKAATDNKGYYEKFYKVVTERENVKKLDKIGRSKFV